MSWWAGLLERLDGCYERCTAENCRFFLLVLAFFSMVLVSGLFSTVK